MIKRWWGWVACVLLGVSANSWATAPVEGTDYQLLSPTQPTSNPGKVVVTEFFSYQCSHCFAFYPSVTAWAAKLPKDVVFERVPVSLGRTAWQPIAQAFYALQAMGKDGEFDKAIFNAIHLQNTRLVDEDGITAFLGKLGVKADDFKAAYHSFSVESDVKRAEQMMKSYKVQGTPTMVVNGKYVILSDGTKDYDDLLARTDKLVAKALAERGGR
jgi:protein dithiol oxidoreductase (disulfide-forming)